jgi:hypothetical protein
MAQCNNESRFSNADRLYSVKTNENNFEVPDGSYSCRTFGLSRFHTGTVDEVSPSMSDCLRGY